MMEANTLDKRGNIVADLTDTQADECIGLMTDLWRTSTEDIRELLEDSNTAWDYYLNNRPNAQTFGTTATKRDKSDVESRRRGLRLGLIPKHTDSIISMQHNNTFPIDDRFFRGTPINKYAKETQELVEQYLALKMAEANITEKFRQLRHNSFLDGTACAACHWKTNKLKKQVHEPRKITIKSPFGFDVSVPIPHSYKSSTKTVTVWEGTDVTPLNFNDWRVDPNAKSMDDTWFMTRWYEEGHALEKRYPDLGKVSSYHSTFDEDDEGTRREDSGLPKRQTSMSKDAEQEGKHKALVVACYNDFILDGEYYENHLAVVVNDQDLVWFGPNPYNHGKIPYIVIPYIPLSNQIYGLSGVKHSIPSAEVADKLTDSMTYKAAYDSNPAFTVNMRDRYLKKHNSIRLRPGIKIPVDTENPLRPIEISMGNVGTMYSLLEKAEQNIEQTIGSSDYLVGNGPDSGNRTTAFEVDARVQGGNSRSQVHMMHFNNMALEAYMYMAYENEKQYMSREVEVNERIIRPIDLKLSDFKWVITSTAATMSRNRRLANTRAFITEILPNLISTGVLNTPYKEVVLMEVKQLLRDSGEAEADTIVDMLREAAGQQGSMMMGPMDAPLQGNTDGLPSANVAPNEGAATPDEGSV